jgi:acyl-CoA reductase-like NAD-dependent aldehyde dehydrogenase
MSDVIKCISPVDGSVFAERPVASEKAIAETFRKARDAQGEWSRLPIAERAKYCSAAVDAMLAMTDEIVPELAWQMGRPVRFGAGEMKGFEERARYMIEIADPALEAHRSGPKPGFKRSITREPLGVVFTIAPWNFPT